MEFLKDFDDKTLDKLTEVLTYINISVPDDDFKRLCFLFTLYIKDYKANRAITEIFRKKDESIRKKLIDILSK